MADVTMKQFDTLPVLTATLIDGKKKPIDLTGATVRLLVKTARGTTPKVSALVTIVNAALGQVSYQFAAGVLNEGATYNFEFAITFADGTEVTCPNDKYLTLQVLPELG